MEMPEDVTGVANTADSEPEGMLSIRLIPAGTPEPEKTRLQKVLDLLELAERERDAHQLHLYQISAALDVPWGEDPLVRIQALLASYR